MIRKNFTIDTANESAAAGESAATETADRIGAPARHALAPAGESHPGGGAAHPG